MKRYFIEIISKATNKNPNFIGTIIRYVYGKSSHIVARQILDKTSQPVKESTPYGELPVLEYDYTHEKYIANEYGFTSKSKAEMVMKKVHDKQDENDYWQSELKVIEIEVE